MLEVDHGGAPPRERSGRALLGQDGPDKQAPWVDLNRCDEIGRKRYVFATLKVQGNEVVHTPVVPVRQLPTTVDGPLNRARDRAHLGDRRRSFEKRTLSQWSPRM
jgi:hypothetical protein